MIITVSVGAMSSYVIPRQVIFLPIAELTRHIRNSQVHASEPMTSAMKELFEGSLYFSRTLFAIICLSIDRYICPAKNIAGTAVKRVELVR